MTSDLNPQELLNPKVFCETARKNGIKPRDLEITSNYFYKICRGERRPSKALVEKLINLLYNDKRVEC